MTSKNLAKFGIRAWRVAGSLVELWKVKGEKIEMLEREGAKYGGGGGVKGMFAALGDFSLGFSDAISECLKRCFSLESRHTSLIGSAYSYRMAASMPYLRSFSIPSSPLSRTTSFHNFFAALPLISIIRASTPQIPSAPKQPILPSVNLMVV